MRERKKHDGITVNAIAGTYVIMFGLDLDPAARKGFRGFGFKRTDHHTGETTWMRGLKTFEATAPFAAPGEMFSTQEHPVQAFQWADYSVHPGRSYTYEIVGLYGKPNALDPKRDVTVDITTELEQGSPHSAWFNRGSVATQEYARRFENEKPSKAGPAAYDWLSRGLLEALLDFLARAKDDDWEIHGAVYEFQWPAVLAALKAARGRKVGVHVIYDDVEVVDKNGKPKGPWKKNREAVEAAKLKSVCEGRANAKLMHNKFFVLSRKGKPQAVWTGSTNLTENGIFGHSNVGHIVEEKDVAVAFREYWGRLDGDPEIDADYRDANELATPAPPEPWEKKTVAVFSPRGTHLDALNWYAAVAGKAKNALMMTFAFGMHDLFKGVYSQDDDVLRIALMEKEGNGSKAVVAKAKKAIQKIRNRPNVVIAIGNRIPTNSFDRWLAELDRITQGVHVYWIHTKYMLVDPLGATPIVVTGSANFSKASTDTNDENMLVIRGDRRITDIYLGEFMRLHTHYAFREFVKWQKEREERTGEPSPLRPQFLATDDSWMDDYWNENDKTGRRSRRMYFSGPMKLDF